MRLLVLACTLSSVLLLARAEVDAPITQHWNGGFLGEACIDITQELHSWTMTLTFDQPLSSLTAFQADVAESKDGGKVYILHNKDWNKDEHVGDRLCVGFQGAINGDVVPKVTASIQGMDGGSTGVATQPPSTGQTSGPVVTSTSGARLQIEGNHFTFGGQKVFLSGGNLPWISYAYDFGDGQWGSRKSQMEDQFKKLHEAGGNSMRLWIHIQGETSPAFDSNGYVTAPDHQGTFINDFKDMLNLAQSYDLLVFPTLWNAAVDQDTSHHLDGLVVDGQKLQSYIDKVLTPLATAVKGHPALGAWDIMNEPEGMINPDVGNSERCFDATAMKNSGAGWAGRKYGFQDIIRFINWQAAAIKNVDSGFLVTVGSWNPKSNTDRMGFVDHYSDDCLVKGGKSNGKIDFYQFHSYSYNGQFDNVSPFSNSAGDYGTGKPIVVGEFWEQDGGGMNINQLFDYVYNHGYAGAWSWDLVGHGDNQRGGISHIRGYNNNGAISINV
ncbi:mannan endo-1,4-beta-mannosidase-like [Physella acuta]|uniref:mannan endo-1,4-beta-mannosidase-like n=1 Tax=Physella acuta TaxID=109671 RepID=UPI0027DB15F9|nr:mannan endo-1,4-beta-mannosidase-like [Physella acuta]